MTESRDAAGSDDTAGPDDAAGPGDATGPDEETAHVLPAEPPADAPPTLAWRLGGILLALGTGLLVGVVGAFVQASRALVGTTALPWGLVLVLVTLVLSVRGASWAVLTRWGGVALFTGWLLATVLLAVESPSGDLALSGGGRQMTYLLAGVILGAAACTVPLMERRERTAVRVPA